VCEADNDFSKKLHKSTTKTQVLPLKDTKKLQKYNKKDPKIGCPIGPKLV
jgi:hypothetical protein